MLFWQNSAIFDIITWFFFLNLKRIYIEKTYKSICIMENKCRILKSHEPQKVIAFNSMESMSYNSQTWKFFVPIIMATLKHLTDNGTVSWKKIHENSKLHTCLYYALGIDKIIFITHFLSILFFIMKFFTP